MNARGLSRYHKVGMSGKRRLVRIHRTHFHSHILSSRDHFENGHASFPQCRNVAEMWHYLAPPVLMSYYYMVFYDIKGYG